jgi:hypothetical protein
VLLLAPAALHFYLAYRLLHGVNDFPNLHALTERLLAFTEHYRQIARPFEWTFTRQDLNNVLTKIADREPHLRLAASRSELPDGSTSA